MTAGITRKQWACLNFIKLYIAENGFSPSYDEISTGLGLASKSNVHRYVGVLVERGRLTRIAGSSRSVTLVPHLAAIRSVSYETPAPTDARLIPVEAGSLADASGKARAG